MSEERPKYGIDDEIRIPITLENPAGIAHVRAVFWRIKQGGSIGTRGLAPNNTLELRGNGKNEEHATVEATLQVNDQHVPGEYLCVSIQVYDPQGNLSVIQNPTPAKSIFIVENGEKGRRKPKFLGWGEDSTN